MRWVSPRRSCWSWFPIGYDSTVIELLDVAGYMTFREYDGLDDIFVYHTKMMCKDGATSVMPRMCV